MDPSTAVRLGSTKVAVTRLGLGTGPIGGWPEPVTEEDARATISAAWEAGVRYFDTAPLYGYGQAETWLGRTLGSYPRSGFSLSTKVGRLLREPREETQADFFTGTGRSVRPVFDFSYDGVMRSFEESIVRLGLDSVDILLLHDPDDHLDEAVDRAYTALDQLRSTGVVGAIGAGMNRTKPLVHLIERLDLDCVMLAGRYTLLDQSAIEVLLPLALRRGVSIMAAGVYNSGILAKQGSGATYDYVPAAPELVDRVRRLRAIAAAHDVPLAAAALQFPLAHPAVANVVIGTRTPATIHENVRLMRFGIPSAFWDSLRQEGLLGDGVPAPTSP
jgi:D-threo-aldose 1-dehydrogenase